ncbi:MAG: glycosyltransferase family 2 protein [Pyrinomonadaceae bacterium]
MSINSPYVTIIVPVYNGAAFLPLCLDAISKSSYKSFEVLVVDDCSIDDSAEISRRSGARVLSTSRNSGPGAARNLAAESALGEILFFVDADVVVQPETIGLVADRFEKQPQISALFGSYDDEPAEKNFLSQYKNLQHHFVHQNSGSDASTFWAGLGAVRRDVFLEFGGFDCKKFAMPMIEDIDLGFRLRKAGHQILLDRSIQAKHLKKWKVMGHLRTEILCRALPWSRLILEDQGMINDMNLKTQDRLSAVLLALSLILLPLAIWQPLLILLIVGCLAAIAFLNREILAFYARKRGFLFALMTLPWQLLYFFYSGVVFVLCWFWYRIPQILGLRTSHETNIS